MLNPEARQPSSASVPAFAASDSPFRSPGELILVVDDQEDIRNLLATVLHGHGYRTLLAVDGNDAVTVFSRHAPTIAAVITDLHMPHIEGRSVADLLRKIRADIPILFMSGLNEASDGRDSRPATSKDPFLLKPFRPIALIEAIHDLLQKRRDSRA
jgi:CheY-like chemotaxis protein